MRAVATGSSAEHGSSMRITFGCTAMARAMHRRCCCPPERPVPGLPRRSSPHPTVRRASGWCTRCHRAARGYAPGHGCGTVSDVVVDRFRERVSVSGTPCDTGGSCARVLALIVNVAAVELDRAGDARPGIYRSLRLRRAGMSTCRTRKGRSSPALAPRYVQVTFFSACLVP